MAINISMAIYSVAVESLPALSAGNVLKKGEGLLSGLISMVCLLIWHPFRNGVSIGGERAV